MNPKPLPGVLRVPCIRCRGERQHLGVGWCWDCMTPAEREKFKHA